MNRGKYPDSEQTKPSRPFRSEGEALWTWKRKFCIYSFPGWGADLRTDDTNVSELVRIANRRSRLDRLGLKAKLCERGANPRQGWDGVLLTSHTNPKTIHSVNPKLTLPQPFLFLLKNAGLESIASSLHSFINNLFSLVSASEYHPTLALPIQA